MELRQDNPYAYGEILEFPNGDLLLVRDRIIIPEADTDRPYTVRDGDTLSNLAGRFFGSSKWLFVILDLNPDVLVNPFDLPTGITLRIPTLQRVKALLQ